LFKEQKIPENPENPEIFLARKSSFSCIPGFPVGDRN
jgi:hypothetical protein